MSGQPDPIGPWAADLEPDERLARTRGLRALCQVLAGSRHPMTVALARAETDPAAAELAWKALETMPALQRRRILGSLAELLKSTPKERKTD